MDSKRYGDEVSYYILLTKIIDDWWTAITDERDCKKAEKGHSPPNMISKPPCPQLKM